ncbi:MAG: hypothetical protein RSE07_07070 [Oscillospiraceae bacterium]
MNKKRKSAYILSLIVLGPPILMLTILAITNKSLFYNIILAVAIISYLVVVICFIVECKSKK